MGLIEDFDHLLEAGNLGVNDIIKELRPKLALNEPACRDIAKLCYADLVTDVVREFPELQGIMGGVYARKEGRDERVALGLEEFYLPAGPKSRIQRRYAARLKL